MELKKSEKSFARKKNCLCCIGAKFCKKKALFVAKLAKFTMVQGANKNTKGKAETFAEILADPPSPPFPIATHLL
jgi:hypothetical protein